MSVKRLHIGKLTLAIEKNGTWIPYIILFIGSLTSIGYLQFHNGHGFEIMIWGKFIFRLCTKGRIRNDLGRVQLRIGERQLI